MASLRTNAFPHPARGAVACATLALLAACGGGGGGGSAVTTPTAQSLAITPANAKAAASDALDNIESDAATGSTGLVGALKALPVGSDATVPALAPVAIAMASQAPTATGMATKASASTTVACTYGGSLAVSGTIASQNGLQAGDSLSMTASNCALSVDGTVATMNGGLSITVNSGSIGAYPFTTMITLTASNLSVRTATDTTTTTGDVTLQWSASSDTSQTLSASGVSFSSTRVSGGTTRTTGWTSYRQEVVIAGTETRQKLDGTLETVNPRLGTGTFRYQVATPAAVVSTAGTFSAGTVDLTGTKSALRMAFKAANALDLQLDADGNGSYEQTITSSTTELRNLP